MTLPEVEDWTQLIQLMGQYAGTPTLVALDASGNIVAVMKGEYAGDLKTLATDADGRLIAILTDPEDVWGTFRQMGLAELAASLTPVKRYDRRGDVIFVDSFEKGMGSWVGATYGTGAAVNLSSKVALFGGISLSLTTGSDGAQAAKASLQLPYPVESKAGLEYSFTHHPNLVYHYFHFYQRDGATRYEYIVRFDIQNGLLSVRTPGPAWTQFASGVTLDTGQDQFHAAKLVADCVNFKYMRFLFNDTSYDLSAYAPYSVAEVVAAYVQAAIQVDGPAGSNLEAFMDNVIVTVNEPA